MIDNILKMKNSSYLTGVSTLVQHTLTIGVPQLPKQ